MNGEKAYNRAMQSKLVVYIQNTHNKLKQNEFKM